MRRRVPGITNEAVARLQEPGELRAAAILSEEFASLKARLLNL